MTPHTDEQRRFSKQVAIKATDPEEQIATGVVMVPDEVDHQLDYAPGWAIRSLEAGWSRRYEDGDVDDGTMHAKFPDGDAETVGSYVLNDAADIGGDEYPADTWVIERQYHNDELWSLVEDGILGGFSIGGRIPEGGVEEYPHDSLPEGVTVPESIDLNANDGPVTEIRAGIINEISDVDRPAVPRATIQALKAGDIEKSPLLRDPEVAQDVLEERGHSPEDAERLANYLTKLEEHNAMTDADDEQDAKADVELDEEDVGFIKRMKSFFAGDTVEKDGRTLREDVQERLRIAHDEIESTLAESDDFSQNRFTDHPQYSTNIDEFDKAAGGSAGLEKAIEELETAKDALDNTDQSMSDGKTQVEENTEKIDEILEIVKSDTDDDEQVDDPDDDTRADGVQAEGEGDSPEVEDGTRADGVEQEGEPDSGETEDGTRADGVEAEDDEEDEDEGKSKADAPEWAKDLSAAVQQNAANIEALAKSSGRSHQLKGAATDAGEEDDVDDGEKLATFMGF